jgi:hypothetical protein
MSSPGLGSLLSLLWSRYIMGEIILHTTSEVFMKTIAYKGYLVQATPDKLADSGRWTIHVYIMRDTGDPARNVTYKSLTGQY